MQKIVFDRKKLFDNMGGMEDLVESSIEIFIEYSPEYLSKIKAAIDVKSVEELKHTAHSFKGSALNAGAPAAAATLLTMEKMGSGEETFDEAGRLFVELEKNIADYIEEVKKQGLV